MRTVKYVEEKNCESNEESTIKSILHQMADVEDKDRFTHVYNVMDNALFMSFFMMKGSCQKSKDFVATRSTLAAH